MDTKIDQLAHILNNLTEKDIEKCAEFIIHENIELQFISHPLNDIIMTNISKYNLYEKLNKCLAKKKSKIYLYVLSKIKNIRKDLKEIILKDNVCDLISYVVNHKIYDNDIKYMILFNAVECLKYYFNQHKEIKSLRKELNEYDYLVINKKRDMFSFLEKTHKIDYNEVLKSCVRLRINNELFRKCFEKINDFEFLIEECGKSHNNECLKFLLEKITEFSISKIIYMKNDQIDYIINLHKFHFDDNDVVKIYFVKDIDYENISKIFKPNISQFKILLKTDFSKHLFVYEIINYFITTISLENIQKECKKEIIDSLIYNFIVIDNEHETIRNSFITLLSNQITEEDGLIELFINETINDSENEIDVDLLEDFAYFLEDCDYELTEYEEDLINYEF